MDLSLLVLAAVLAVIVTGRVAGLNVVIWQAMTGGALAALVTGQIGVADAMKAIDLDVVLFLFGMFVVGEGLV